MVSFRCISAVLFAGISPFLECPPLPSGLSGIKVSLVYQCGPESLEVLHDGQDWTVKTKGPLASVGSRARAGVFFSDNGHGVVSIYSYLDRSSISVELKKRLLAVHGQVDPAQLQQDLGDGFYAVDLAPLGDGLYVLDTEHPSVYLVPLSGPARIVVAADDLSSLYGPKGWEGGPAGRRSIRVSPGGRIAVTVPGPPFGGLGQHRPLTLILSSRKSPLRLGLGTQLAWIGEDRLALSVPGASHSVRVFQVSSGRTVTRKFTFAAWDGNRFLWRGDDVLRQRKRYDEDSELPKPFPQIFCRELQGLGADLRTRSGSLRLPIPLVTWLENPLIAGG
jgi:hypothetical protein